MRPLLIYQSLILSNNTIQTLVFPGVHEAQHYPLSELIQHSAARNLTVDKIKAAGNTLGLTLPDTTKKPLLLAAAQAQITAQGHSPDIVVDALARALYRAEVAPHLAGLPDSMRQQLATAGLL